MGFIKCASGGYAIGGNELYLEYNVLGQNQSGNYSTVRFQLVLNSYDYGGGSWAGDSPGCFIDVPAGRIYGSGNFDTNNQYSVLITYDQTIGHDANGNCSFGVGGQHTTGTQLGNASCSGTVTLPRIDRGAILNSVSFANDEANPVFNFTKYGGWQQFWLEFAPIGGSAATTYITSTPGKEVTSPYTFVLTEAQRNQIRAKCPNDKTIRIRCGIKTTLSGSPYQWPSYKDYTVSIVNGEPTFSSANITLTDANSTTVALTGNAAKIIPGFSKMKAAVSTKAVGKKSATINKYSFSLTGDTAVYDVVEQAAAVSYTFNPSSNTSVDVVATDSRGFTTKATKAGTVINYTPPSLSGVTLARSSGGTGSTVTLSYNGAFWNGSFGAVSNTLTFSYKYRQVGATAWTTGTVGLTYSASGNTFSGSKAIGSFNVGGSYELQLTVYDKLSTAVLVGVIPIAQPAMKISGNSAIFPKDTLKFEDSLGTRKLLVDLIYPVGSVFMSFNDTNPSSFIGGSWTKITDTFLVAAGETYKVGSNGGADSVKLTASNLPSITGSIMFHGSENGGPAWQANGCFGSSNIHGSKYRTGGDYAGGAHSNQNIKFNNGGSGASFDARPPYMPVYMWKREA
ncbi:phage baseplate protein [Eubacterium sp.]|uniref:phage baseplate protein n=1 Tax=Eubacterium sp. TaxID=142586 RepID=UPI002FCBA181